MLASAQQLHSALPGIYIDAQVSRQMAAGLAEVSSLAAEGLLRRVVIVGLGTNGTVTSGQIRDLLAEVGPSRKLVLVNTYEARPWEHADNSVIGAAARRYPNVVLANWHATIADRTSLLWGDGVHPRPPGARLYAKMVADAVQATASARARAGHERQDQPIFRCEVRARDALHVRRGQLLKDLELAVGGLDVVMNHDRVGQLAGFLLIRLAPEDVVARELILRALQLVLADRLGLQLVELRDQPVDRLLRPMAWLDERDGIKQIRILDDIRLAGRGERDALVVDELLVNA